MSPIINLGFISIHWYSIMLFLAILFGSNVAIDEAKKQAQLTIQQAQEEGSRIKNNLIEQGKQQSQQIVDEAVANINLQKDKMLQDMHRQMVDVALSATEKMLQTKINTQTDIDSIDSFVKEVSQQ